jgi:hypothetical protein
MADGPGRRFTPWYPLVEAEARVPSEAGVFQVRAAELLSYPRGRSAMIHYGSGQKLRAAVRAFVAAHGTHDWLCRHVTALDARMPDAHRERLASRFRSRFGSDPRPPDPPASRGPGEA